MAEESSVIIGRRVRIPTKVLLDDMMWQLQFLNVVYSTRKERTVGLDATVEFYSLGHKHHLGLDMSSMTWKT